MIIFLSVISACIQHHRLALPVTMKLSGNCRLITATAVPAALGPGAGVGTTGAGAGVGTTGAGAGVGTTGAGAGVGTTGAGAGASDGVGTGASDGVGASMGGISAGGVGSFGGGGETQLGLPSCIEIQASVKLRKV